MLLRVQELKYICIFQCQISKTLLIRFLITFYYISFPVFVNYSFHLFIYHFKVCDLKKKEFSKIRDTIWSN